jgi:hypothetical protein
VYHADVDQERAVANFFKVDNAHQLFAIKHDWYRNKRG